MVVIRLKEECFPGVEGFKVILSYKVGYFLFLVLTRNMLRDWFLPLDFE